MGSGVSIPLPVSVGEPGSSVVEDGGGAAEGASTQYEKPVLKFEQSGVMEGFQARKFSRLIPHSAGIFWQLIEPSLSHHQAQSGFVFGSKGIWGLSSMS